MKALKKLGQHFLEDRQIIKMICAHVSEDHDLLIEIGPGQGALTEELAKKTSKYLVVEKDERFLTILEQFIHKDQIIIEDALSLDFNTLFAQKCIKNNRQISLVANLPYNIAIPLFIKFIQISNLTHLTLMFQKEVARKIISIDASPPHKDKGSLMILSDNFFYCRHLFDISSRSFNPPPQVDSSVVSLVRKKNPLVPLKEFKQLESFLRKIFSQRRKQMKKVLAPYYSVELILSTMDRLNLPIHTRAEALKLKDIINLYQILKKNGARYEDHC